MLHGFFYIIFKQYENYQDQEELSGGQSFRQKQVKSKNDKDHINLKSKKTWNVKHYYIVQLKYDLSRWAITPTCWRLKISEISDYSMCPNTKLRLTETNNAII